MIRMSSNGDGFCKREKSQQAEIRYLPTWMNIPVCKDEGIMDCAKISYSSKVEGGHKKIRKDLKDGETKMEETPSSTIIQRQSSGYHCFKMIYIQKF